MNKNFNERRDGTMPGECTCRAIFICDGIKWIPTCPTHGEDGTLSGEYTCGIITTFEDTEEE